MTANMEISTTVGCKMNCGYCPQKLHVKKYTEKSRDTVMSDRTFLTCLSKIPKTTEIIFAGMAEPWLNPIATNMEVVLCCMDYSQDHVIGNLLTDSYDDLFRSKEYNRIMQGLEDDGLDILCRKCEISHAE